MNVSLASSPVSGLGSLPRQSSFAERLGELKPLRATPSRVAVSASTVTSTKVARGLDALRASESRLNAVVKLASSGRTFTPAQLLSFQSQVYGASQRLDLAGHVIDKASSGVKQVLQTQV